MDPRNEKEKAEKEKAEDLKLMKDPLYNESEYCGKSMTTFEDTIKEL